MGLSDFLYGPFGGLKHSELHKMAFRSKFSDNLPWVAYDPATKLFHNTDETAGFMWECVPLCLADRKSIDILSGLFRVGLPEGSVMQFILYSDRHIDPFLDAYAHGKVRKEPIIAKTTEACRRFFKDGTGGIDNLGGIPVRNFRLFVTVKVPKQKDGSIGLDMKDLCANIQERLKGAGLGPQLMDAYEVIDLMRRFFNNREFPQISASKKDEAWDQDVPIRKQIILAETEINKTLDKMVIGDRIFRCTTPKSCPREVNPLQTNELFGGIRGLENDAEQIRTPFLYCFNIVFENLKTAIHAKCTMVLQQQAAGSFAPSLNRKKEEFLWASDEVEKGTQFVKVIPVCWVWGNEKEVNDAITRVKRVWEAKGYLMQEDKGILPLMFISSLPFGLYNVGANVENMDRYFIVPAASAANLLPVQADFAGGGRPVVLFTGRKGQIATLDVFDKHANNHNIFVCASSGAGKSFFVNYLAYNYYASNALIRIIDIGGSYKKMTKLFGARYMDFDGESKICLNPFTNVRDMEIDISVIASIVAQMAFSATDTPPDNEAETAMGLIRAAVKAAWVKLENDASIDTVYEYLADFPQSDPELRATEKMIAIAHDLAFNLTEFTTRGSYGRWFNGRSNFDISNDQFVVLELENLRPQKELFKVVTLQVINAVTADLYQSDRSRRRLIIFDEAWQFLGGDSKMLCDVIESGYRRARKYGGSFTVITQSLMDLQQFGNVGNVIRSNSDFKFYLQSDDFEKAKEAKLIEYDDFMLDLLKTTKSNKPYYSEIFMESPFGTGVCRLVVDPFSFFVYTSDPGHIAAIETLVDGGMSYDKACEFMVGNVKAISSLVDGGMSWDKAAEYVVTRKAA